MDDTTTEWAARASRARQRRAAAVLVAASALMLAGCGGSDDGGEADDTPAVTDTVTDMDTDTATGTEAGAGSSEAGAKVFASAGCGGCHTLADAGSSGAVGPNLDEAQPSHELVVERVTNGKGVMPSFADQLTSAQIQDVATYVSEAT